MQSPTSEATTQVSEFPGNVSVENSLSINSRGNVYVRALDKSWSLATLDDPAAHFSAILAQVKGVESSALTSDHFFDNIQLDITNNCNLRCPFCSSNFSHADSHRMEVDIFDKALELMPLAPLGGFFLSCAFEITLHRNFSELIARVPAAHRYKCFFTTNLSVKLSDQTIENIVSSNVGWFNVSIESFDKDLFEYFRANAKFDVFQDNLERLSLAVRKAGRGPKLRFISMVFKQNYDEIESVIRRCHDYGAYDHELRLPFVIPSTNQTPEWRALSFISLEEFEDLQTRLSKTGLRVKYFNAQYPPLYWRMQNTSFIVD